MLHFAYFQSWFSFSFFFFFIILVHYYYEIVHCVVRVPVLALIYDITLLILYAPQLYYIFVVVVVAVFVS